MQKDAKGDAQERELRRYQLHNQASDLLEAGDNEGCLKCIQELRRGDPQEPWIDHIKGFLLSESGNQAQAIPLLRRAAKLLPDRLEPKITLGIALMKDGKEDEAEQLLEEALELEPNSFLAMTNLGCVLLTRVEKPCLERAEKLLRRADELMPEDAAIWASLGHALVLQGRQPEAQEALLKAIRVDTTGQQCCWIAQLYPEFAAKAQFKLTELEMSWREKSSRRPGSKN